MKATENIPLFSLVEKVLDLWIIELLEVVEFFLDVPQESLLVLRCKLRPSKLGLLLRKGVVKLRNLWDGPPGTVGGRGWGSPRVSSWDPSQWSPHWLRSASDLPFFPHTPPENCSEHAGWSPPPLCWKSILVPGSRPHWRSQDTSGRSRPSRETWRPFLRFVSPPGCAGRGSRK